MKLFKKLACLTLSMCMILAGFTVTPQHTAYASASSYNSDLSFLSSLGITSGIDTSDSGRVVSRAEFVAMAVKIINPNLNIKFTGSFADVTSETIYSNEIYTALTYGLLNGTAQGTFSPDSPITYAAALKILVAALGYEEYAFISGGYPTGYIMQADAIDLTYGIAAYGANDSVSLETAVSLIAKEGTTYTTISAFSIVFSKSQVNSIPTGISTSGRSFSTTFLATSCGLFVATARVTSSAERVYRTSFIPSYTLVLSR